ncbi:MAG: hypothetical protein OEW30_03620 [Acidimicrobiia bacterium]|nr:hypothetical protein [Acidimicrobiia bacterium]
MPSVWQSGPHARGRRQSGVRSGLASVSSAASIAEAAELVTPLDKMCCEPGPRMAAIADRPQSAGALIDTEAAAALVRFEEMRGMVGALQVGCCAPARMPPYARVLEHLTSAQREVNEALGRGH